MFRGICAVCLIYFVICADVSSASRRQKRIVGGEPANPPPSGASEAEDVVVNPALESVQPVNPPDNNVDNNTPPPTSNDDDGGPIVFLRRGRREARVKGRRDSQGYYSFQGIRYAEPPVGKLRFQRPRQTKPQGDLEAKTPGPPCPQTVGQTLIGTEDCLFLNIYSPEIPKGNRSSRQEDKNYPVLFWIHGGGFRRGSGSQYGPAQLVKKGLVVVTIQYRLGSLGFLSTNRKELPGNAGLFDIFTSLKWVRKYIKFFGGNPDHIVPAGQGSGASAATMLTLAQFSRSWIKGVFAMSGSAISSFAVDKEPEQTAREVSAIDSCKSVSEPLAFVRCMQKLPVESIIKGDNKVQDGRLSNNDATQSYLTSISKLLNPGPAVEGEDDQRFLPNFLTSSPEEILQKGDFAKVPLLTGVTKDETSTSAKGGGIASKLLGGLAATEELVEKMIPQLLNINSGLFGKNLLSPVLTNLLGNNLNQLTKGVTSSLDGMASALDKIIEMTTDALFNLPAFLTSQLWSKQSKAYLYSFEHDGRMTTANDFLQDSPLTEQNSHVEGAGHGDDLVYLFDVFTIDGQPLQNATLKDPDDMKVREQFTDLVAEFVRTGEPKIGGRSVPPFTQEGGDYMIINSTSSLGKGFRKCQMGLWAGIGEILKSSECSFLQLGDLVNSLGLGKLTKPVGDLGLGGLVGGNNGGGGLVGGNNGGGGLVGGLVGGNNAATQKPGGLGGLLGGNKAQGQTPSSGGGLVGGLVGGNNAATQKPAGLGGLLGGNRGQAQTPSSGGGLVGGLVGGNNAATQKPAGLGGLLGGNRGQSQKPSGGGGLLGGLG